MTKPPPVHGHAQHDPIDEPAPGIVGIDGIRAAAERLERVAHRTPVLTSRTLDMWSGATVLMKAENFQRAGAFKFRGAYNKIASLTPEQLARGVCTWSSGNHAQAVALAASLLGTTATVLMPTDSPATKRAATEGYGASVVTYDRYSEDREALAGELATDRGLVPIPAYDDPLVMAGQGTAALELLEDVGELDVLVVPMSGGALMAGCGTAARALLPGVELIGAEPAAGDDTKRSLTAGERVRIPVPHTIADGQQVEIPGRLTFEVNRRQVDDVLLVEDDDLVDAMRFMFERLKVVVEPSGVSALTAVLTHPDRFRGRRVGVILSGGNVGVDRFLSLLAGAQTR
ncbi:pyridoxal-phosphate dependent enzyme [Jatrophihabitans sp. DSM 44399]|uniref:Pyridoxal-phosphate dependent enzyme n=1 Tax=Jatrophihabitans lederbergiae TaxID=3075547 RepID=A0ABU2JHE6_9ACTN|nr:pyridoxal-phosphate dependent enzyme [Jatrophihabitans sp. DSM 44399]MDT0264407.1 pyridoxal-phosphate dependent enzyme [Jatrophihabitans sp. DSM 44399]